MKIYSEVLNKFYESVDECEEAEKKFEEEQEAKKAEKKKKDEERAARAKEVEDAFKALKAAQKHYDDVLTQFLKDYKVYHYSGNSLSDFPSALSLLDPFNWVKKW